MANLDDLIDQASSKKSSPPLSGNIYGYVVAPVPVGINDKCYVVLPDISQEIKWGPCRWPKSALSIMAANREVLVVFDNRQTPWVIAVW